MAKRPPTIERPVDCDILAEQKRARLVTSAPRLRNKLKQGGSDKSSGRDSFSLYVQHLKKHGVPLLKKPGEIGLARQLALLAIYHICQRLMVAQAILKPRNRRLYRRAVPLAHAFLAEFNPKGLTDKRLDKHLHNVIYNQGAGVEVMLRFVENDADGKLIIKRFIDSNLRLVVNVAKKWNNGMLPIMELVQEGNIGLMHAVPRFDYRRGLRFSTFAVWWIRHAIGRAIADKARGIRLPVHLIEVDGKIKQASAKLSVELGRKPTDDELAKAVGISVSKVRDIERWTMMPTSLDAPSHENGHTTVGDDTADEPEEVVGDWATLIPGKDIKLLRAAMGRLNPVQADVLRQRFGLGDDKQKTFQEIGAQYQLSRERIRQLQNEGLARLRQILSRQLGAAA